MASKSKEIVFDEADFNRCCFAQIMPDRKNYQIQTKNLTTIAMWETIHNAGIQTDTFHRDDEIIFQLDCVAFIDSPGECHVVPKKGTKHPSSHQAFFACKGQFVSINTPQQEFVLTRQTIQMMQYEGEYANFHQQIQVIDQWAVAGPTTHMSKEDKISAFLKTISKDCK